MYKVLYVIDTLEVGGAERSLLQIAQRLDRSRIQLTVCHPYRGASLRADFEESGVRVVGLGLRGKYQFPTAVRRLRRVAKREQPDLIHTTLFRSDQIGRTVARWLNLPVVSSFVNLSYDSSRLSGNQYVNARKLGALRFLDSLTARWVTHFHAVSETVKYSNCKQLRVSPQRVSVIPRGRELSAFQKGGGQTRARGRQRARGERARGGQAHFAAKTPQNEPVPNSAGTWKTESPTILNVGRLVDQKAQRFAIQAMKAVVEEHPDAKLLIAGEGPLRDDLEQLATRLGLQQHVHLLGHCDNVDELLRSADMFVFPSIYEGMPGSVIEAMLSGLPIVASNIAPIRELVAHNNTGILVEPRNSAVLANAMSRLIDDRELAGRLGQHAHLCAAERFDVEKVASRMQDFYEEIIRSSGFGRSGVRRRNVGVGTNGKCFQISPTANAKDAVSV